MYSADDSDPSDIFVVDFKLRPDLVVDQNAV